MFSLFSVGIWYGMMSGSVVQALVLSFIIYRTNWNKEASVAEDRIKKWGGGQISSKENNIGTVTFA
ncbi:hypothetical protein MANES_12G023501v8 [Manihot esculenta]|uniref:Uncharacterized protein n=1 Tax=Manihot esculenta TaxID=3983 RepID=A0ACB7GP13_MANES|nr:hypothetical protein MANES_12G023501v8 [Manihot esculenta]